MRERKGKAESADPVYLLARAIQAAHLDLVVEDNPYGIRPGNAPLPGLGQHAGYERLALRLLARGVRAPGQDEFHRQESYILELLDEIRRLKRENERLIQELKEVR